MIDNIEKKMIPPKILLSIFAVILIMLVPAPSLATEDTCDLPTVAIEVPIGTVGSVAGLTKYISVLYQFLVGGVGILAAVMIMVNGLRWAAAAGNSEQISEAKSGIVGALIGLLLALSSYLILTNINRNLVYLPEICPEGIQFSGTLSQTGWDVCPNGTVTECSEADYCQYDGGCECVNVGTGEKEFVCRPIGTEALPTNYRCKEDANCSGYASGSLECVGANATGTVPGHCTEKQTNQTCTTDEDCTAPYTCEDSNTSGSKQCLTATGRADYVSCDSDLNCESTFCNESVGICTAGDGTEDSSIAPCSTESDCATGYKCSSSSCTAKTEGDSCDGFNSDCGTGLFCVDSGVVGQKCYDGSIGDPCDDSSDCSSGYSCNGTITPTCEL